jgi:hypothetical protein
MKNRLRRSAFQSQQFLADKGGNGTWSEIAANKRLVIELNTGNGNSLIGMRRRKLGVMIRSHYRGHP